MAESVAKTHVLVILRDDMTPEAIEGLCQRIVRMSGVADAFIGHMEGAPLPTARTETLH